MYDAESRNGRAVKAVDASATGRILIVDADRAFGGFMLAALESRGHDVDCAGCVADGLACLYAARYDLVILELQLPDGSGMELLRDATDEGLLGDSAAVLLTGQAFEEPNDIRVFRKPLDLEPFLDRVGDIVAHTQRRRQAGPRRSVPHLSAARDRGHPANSHKVELVLYTSAASEKSQKALRTVRSVLEQYDTAEISFSINDLSHTNTTADEDAVVFTPTLVKRAPGPRTWIVGNLDHPDLLIDLLEASGVRRRRG